MIDREVVSSNFKDIVVHDYAPIDPHMVVGIFRNDLSDLVRFTREVLRYMDLPDAGSPS